MDKILMAAVYLATTNDNYAGRCAKITIPTNDSPKEIKISESKENSNNVKRKSKNLCFNLRCGPEKGNNY